MYFFVCLDFCTQHIIIMRLIMLYASVAWYFLLLSSIELCADTSICLSIYLPIDLDFSVL